MVRGRLERSEPSMTRLWRKIKFRLGRKAPPPGALAHARDTPAKPHNHSMSASSLRSLAARRRLDEGAR
jgi:hypothetical protein